MGRLHCTAYSDPHGQLGSKNVYHDDADQPALTRLTDSRGHVSWSVGGNVVAEEKAHEIMKQLGWSALLPPILPAGGEAQYVQKAESCTGGSVPPRPEPEPRPAPRFDPVAANPYRRSAPPPSTDQPPAPAKFDPVAASPYRYQPPKPKPGPPRPFVPRQDYLGLGKETKR